MKRLVSLATCAVIMLLQMAQPVVATPVRDEITAFSVECGPIGIPPDHRLYPVSVTFSHGPGRELSVSGLGAETLTILFHPPGTATYTSTIAASLMTTSLHAELLRFDHRAKTHVTVASATLALPSCP